MDNEIIKWREEQKHLPEFMRDFHNCKELFKAVDQLITCDEESPAAKVSWLQGHCYTIDVFLWFMARYGYTLQRNRTKLAFEDLEETLKALQLERNKGFAEMLSKAV